VSEKPLRIATRASRLARWQADHVAELLGRAAPARNVELVEVSTTGDLDRARALHEFGGVGVFTREVQRAVLDGRADLAVHSLKDLPTEPVQGLTLAAVPQRGPMFDLLVFPAGTEPAGRLESLPDGARVGTGSLRRQAQLLHRRADLQMCEVRGNVETRLRKLDEGQFDALVLAEAGLSRLGLLSGRTTLKLQPPLMFPAVGQGALGIECRAADVELQSLLEQLTHRPTFRAVTAERSLLAELRAGCHAPLGVMTHQNKEELTLEAVLLSPDGRTRLHELASGPADDPASLGRQVADELRRQGADELISAAG
jgi:hydroxymethylbilane synthase